jgi:ABC-type branched-subunit amino acid transport system substrate-binding protein
MRNNGLKTFALVVAAFLLLSWVRLQPGTSGAGGVSSNRDAERKADDASVTDDASTDNGPADETSGGSKGSTATSVLNPSNLKCNASGNGGATAKGVTANRINLATTAVLDGPARSLLEDSPTAMKAVIGKVNRAGGICGRLLNLRVVNDSFKAEVGLRSIQNFIDESYFSLPVVPSAEGLGSAITNGVISKAGIPVIGTDGMRKEQYSDANVWPVASATVTAMRTMAKYAFTQRGARRFAIVWDQKYQFGKEGQAAFVAQVKAMGGEMVSGGDVGLNPDDNSYGSAINEFNSKCKDKCDMVALLLLPETAKKWFQGGADFGTRYTAGAQTLFTDGFAQACVSFRGNECNGFAVWTGYNPPIGPLASKPGVAAYVNDVRAVKPGIDINNQFVEGAYLGMTVFVEALKRVGPQLTRERLKQVMDSMVFESDLASSLSWKPGQHTANTRSQSFSMSVSQGAFRGWSDEGTGFLLDPAFGG